LLRRERPDPPIHVRPATEVDSRPLGESATVAGPNRSSRAGAGLVKVRRGVAEVVGKRAAYVVLLALSALVTSVE